MTAKLTPINWRANTLAADTARDLRELADLVDAGRVEDVVLIAQMDGSYRVETNASAFDTLALVAILQDWAIGKARR